ncbi:MAG: sigma-70 family RNA polymerase sigma factor [Calditrichaeota bacterium]|nr:MAG: sigma-70 family RNA polymerase sigma factor [Calditrichota bacterium]
MDIFRKKYSRFSDEELMRLIRISDIHAFDEIYRRYSKRILHYFYRMLGESENKAQDFLQDLFLKIVEKPERFDSSKKFSTWIFAIAYNQCKNEYRRLGVRQAYARERSRENSDFLHQSESPVEKELDRKSLRQSLIRELTKYDPGTRHVFLLRLQENMSIREISEITGYKEGTVKSKLFYITRKLAENLKEYHPLYKEVK